MKRLQLVGVLLGAAVAAPTLAANDDAAPDRPTFTRDVLPIMQRSCQTCHRPNMFTPMSLLTYDEVRPWARSIKQRVEARMMPPWFADRTVGVYRDDPSLSETEIATVARWVDQGAARGNPTDAPAGRASGRPSTPGITARSRTWFSRVRRSRCCPTRPRRFPSQSCRPD